MGGAVEIKIAKVKIKTFRRSRDLPSKQRHVSSHTLPAPPPGPMAPDEHRQRLDLTRNPYMAKISTYDVRDPVEVSRADVLKIQNGRTLTPNAIDFGLYSLFNSYKETLRDYNSCCMVPCVAWRDWSSTQERRISHHNSLPPSLFQYIIVPVMITPPLAPGSVSLPLDEWLIAIIANSSLLRAPGIDEDPEPPADGNQAKPTLIILDSAPRPNGRRLKRPEFEKSLIKFAGTVWPQTSKQALGVLKKQIFYPEVSLTHLLFPHVSVDLTPTS